MRCWNDVLRGHWRRGITSRLSEAEIERILHNKHYVSLTHLPTLKTSSWVNSARLMTWSKRASPLAISPFTIDTGGWALRGVASATSMARLATMPRPFGDEVPALILGPKKWRSHAELGKTVPFVRADWEWCNLKYKEGKADAAKHHDELAAFL